MNRKQIIEISLCLEKQGYFNPSFFISMEKHMNNYPDAWLTILKSFAIDIIEDLNITYKKEVKQ